MQCLSFDLLTPESPSMEAPCEEMHDEDTDDLTYSVCKNDGAAPRHRPPSSCIILHYEFA